MHNPIDPETHLRNLAASTRRHIDNNHRAAQRRDRGLPNTTRRVRFRRG